MSKILTLHKSTSNLIYIGLGFLVMIMVITWMKPETAQTTLPNQTAQPPSSITDSQTTALQTDALTTTNNPVDSALPHATTNIPFITGLEFLSTSLQGTEVDGELLINDQKQLIISEGLRRLFDYFLSAQGEEDIDTIKARVESFILYHAPQPAASQAIAIFHNYIDYLKALPALKNRYGNFQLQATTAGQLDLNLLQQRKSDMARLRRQYFDNATVAAFFTGEEEYEAYTIAMLEIDANDTWDEVQKEAARNDYISRLPDNPIKSNIVQQADLQSLIEQTEKLKSEGASAQQLYQVRRQLFGAPAATRLAIVDNEDEDFDRRFTEYQTQKGLILSKDLSHAQAALKIKELEGTLFSETERKRLVGYAGYKQLHASLEE